METDIYRAPDAELQGEQAAAEHEFYVVSKNKFLLLMIGTFGLYEFYWFYKNWSLYKKHSGADMLPVMRAIFSIFFVHSLFRTVEDRNLDNGGESTWSPAWMATLYVVLSIASSIADRISAKMVEYTALDLVSLVALPIIVWVLYRAQHMINIVCGDPNGESNSEITPANYLWVAIGLLFWGLIAIGFYDAFVGLPL